jgi:glycosyltransferase involved in cell wall biosynthesis
MKYNKMRVLYIFSGVRRKKFTGKPGVDYPDTQFYGMNHLSLFGMDSEYKEPEDYFLGRLISKFLGFRFKHVFMFFVARKYDIVFGISIIYMLFWKKIFSTKTKFIIFNSVLNRMFLVHKEGTIGHFLLIFVLKEVDAIVFLSHTHLGKVLKSAPFLKDRCFFVPMGVDIEFFKPNYERKDNFFLSVGRDNARDYKTVIEVAKRMPKEEFHLVCLPRNIEAIKKIPSNVKIHVNIPSKALREMYNKATALLLIVHNDSYPEGSDSSGPTVLLEAMANGLPVIASRKDYLSDYIEHNQDAILVDFYDIDAIVSAIFSLKEISFRKRLALNARLKTEKSFNTKDMARSLSKIFNKVYER